MILIRSIPYTLTDSWPLLGLAAAYALFAAGFRDYSLANGVDAIFWLPGGIGLAALLIWGGKYWPGILAGGVLAGFWAHDPLATALPAALGHALECLCAAWLLLKLRPDFDIRFNRSADFVGIIMAAVPAAGLCAVIGTLALWQSGVFPTEQLAGHMLRWWQADLLGIVVGTPLVLAWRELPRAWFSHSLRSLETLGFLLLSIFVTQIVFRDGFGSIFSLIARGHWVFLLILWAAFRFERQGVLLLLLLVSGQSLLGAGWHQGFFADDMQATGLQNVWCYQLVISLVGILLVLNLNARRQAERLLLDKISELKNTEEDLHLAALVYQSSSEAMMITDADNRIISINPAFTACTGYSLPEVLGKNPRILSSGRQSSEFYQNMWQALNTSGRWQGEIYNRRKNAEIYVEWVIINTVFDAEGAVQRRVALFSDITEKKKAEETIWFQANYDPLTQLPNRRLFADRLQQELLKAKRDRKGLALLFIDLDHFKDINDSLGHEKGDELLAEAARRLLQCVRQSDTVARLGGDEFTIIVTELNDYADMEGIAQNILRALEQPFMLGAGLFYISASIGIAFYPTDTESLDDLIRYADQAMYAAKHKGRKCYCCFDPSMQAAMETHVQLGLDLRDALAKNQFEVYYQPVVDLSSGEIVKAEALLRWNHPLRGMVMPGEFIAVAEETGAINDIGDWVFKQAALQARVWRQTYLADFQISVNKSPVQFHTQDQTHNHWTEYLEKIGLSGGGIVVEITEGLLLDASRQIASKLLHFRDCGIQVAIDDFGTGYSALSYLEKFDIDYLKIDQSFTRNLTTSSSDQALCEAIVVMAHKLGLKVIAEGVETEQQRDLLIEIGCDYGQGYLYAKPLPAREFEGLLTAGSS